MCSLILDYAPGADNTRRPRDGNDPGEGNLPSLCGSAPSPTGLDPGTGSWTTHRRVPRERCPAVEVQAGATKVSRSMGPSTKQPPHLATP